MFTSFCRSYRRTLTENSFTIIFFQYFLFVKFKRASSRWENLEIRRKSRKKYFVSNWISMNFKTLKDFDWSNFSFYRPTEMSMFIWELKVKNWMFTWREKNNQSSFFRDFWAFLKALFCLMQTFKSEIDSNNQNV